MEGHPEATRPTSCARPAPNLPRGPGCEQTNESLDQAECDVRFLAGQGPEQSRGDLAGRGIGAGTECHLGPQGAQDSGSFCNDFWVLCSPKGGP